MATTTNYSWSTPDNTAYVKDGASAIRTLGSSVDTTLYTALGFNYPGLRLIKKQTIGSAVATVTVTGAFSATYENYKVVISGGVGSVANYLTFALGASATGYKFGAMSAPYASGTPTAFSASTGTTKFSDIGAFNSNFISTNLEIGCPFLAKYTTFTTNYNYDGGLVTYGGLHAVATSYTDFTIGTGSGTLTGGTIYVYGYGAS